MESRSGGDNSLDRVAAGAGALRRFASALDLVDHVAAARMGVNRTDLRIVEVLSRAPDGVAPSELAELVGLSRPAITAAVNRLEDRGLVHREHRRSNRRQVRVTPTNQARTAVGPIFEELSRRVEHTLQGLRLEELTALTDTVELITAQIESLAREQSLPG